MEGTEGGYREENGVEEDEEDLEAEKTDIGGRRVSPLVVAAVAVVEMCIGMKGIGRGWSKQ